MTNIKEEDIFIRVPIFSEEECATISDKILSLKEHFTPRSMYASGERIMEQDVDFYTLGSSTYLDLDKAHSVNPANGVITKEFQSEFGKLCTAMEGALGERVNLDNRLNTPGFHVFTGKEGVPKGVAYGGSIHRDTPHQWLPIQESFIRPISFTMMITAPANGAGMNYWTDREVNSQIASSKFQQLDLALQQKVEETARYFEYNIGELVLHRGDVLHQVANMVDSTKEDNRISLQGHGVLVDSGYIIYF